MKYNFKLYFQRTYYRISTSVIETLHIMHLPSATPGGTIPGYLHAWHQAFSQKGVQASWDAHRTKNGRLWTPKFWGKREIIFNDFPKFNISETK
jgi:hypothetical protein